MQMHMERADEYGDDEHVRRREAALANAGFGGRAAFAFETNGCKANASALWDCLHAIEAMTANAGARALVGPLAGRARRRFVMVLRLIWIDVSTCWLYVCLLIFAR
jgi:hypothetical protein